MKKQAKQFTSLLCVLVLCLTLLPVSALASGLEEPGTPKSTPTASMSLEPSVEPSPEPTPEESTEPELVDSAEPTPVPTETPAPENETELFANEMQTEFYVGGEGASDEEGDGTRENPYATLAKVAEYINQREYGGTYFIYVMDDITSTACARFYNCYVTITSYGDEPHTVTRGENFNKQPEPARQWYNPAMLEIGKSGTDEDGNFLWAGTSRLTLENIVFDDKGLHEGEYFLQAGIKDLPDGANSQNIVQDAIIATYNGTSDIILGEGAILKNYGGMSAIRASGGTVTMKSGSAIYDDSNVVDDREKGTSGSFGPAGAIWLQGGELTMEEGSEIRDMVGRAVCADGGKSTINGTIKNIKGDPDMWFAMNGIAVHGRGQSETILGVDSVIESISGSESSGTAVYTDVAKLTMNGSIRQCTGLASAVYLSNSSDSNAATLNGIIEENTLVGSNGYVVSVGNSHFTISKTGMICNNKSNISTIYASPGTVMDLYGSIKNNKSGQCGGIHIDINWSSPVTVNMYTGACITGNSAGDVEASSSPKDRGGAVCCSGNRDSGTVFNMYGGIISGNSSSEGTIFVRKHGEFHMYGGVITENIGAGVRVDGSEGNPLFTMMGGQITDNTSYGVTYTTGSNSVVKLEEGGISGNNNGNEQIKISGNASSTDTVHHIEIAPNVLLKNTAIALPFGLITLDSNYGDIALGIASKNAKDDMISKLPIDQGEDSRKWEAVEDTALWFKPTTDSFHFTMPKSYSVENGRGLYAGYIPLKEDGTPADNAALTVVPVENEAILDITVSNLTPDTSYALMLIHSNEYTIKPDDITIYTGGETEGGLPNGTFVNSTLEASDISSITIGDTTTNYTYSNRNEGYELLNSLFEVTGYYNTDNQQIKNDQIPGEYTAQIGLTDAANQKGLFVADDGLVSGLKINGNTVKLADGILTIRYVSDTDEAIQDDGLTTDIVSDDAGVNEALSNADGKGIALIKGTPT